MLKPSEVLADLYETNNLIGPPGPPTPKTALALRRKKALLGHTISGCVYPRRVYGYCAGSQRNVCFPWRWRRRARVDHSH
jgi:hypothetical protein